MPNSTNSKPAAASAPAPGGGAEGSAAETVKTPAAAEVIEQSAKPALTPATAEKKAPASNPVKGEPSGSDLAARIAQLEQQQAATSKELAEAKEAAARAELAKLRAEVAAAKSLPADLQEFLTADTKEALEGQADKLLTYAGKRRSAPAPDPTQGKSSSVPLNSSSLEDAFRRAFER